MNNLYQTELKFSKESLASLIGVNPDIVSHLFVDPHSDMLTVVLKSELQFAATNNGICQLYQICEGQARVQKNWKLISF